MSVNSRTKRRQS